MNSSLGKEAQGVAEHEPVPPMTPPAHTAQAKSAGRLSRAEMVLVATEVFVALTAGGGGIALITGLEGKQFPLALLKYTPFSSYLIPGLILGVTVGGSTAVAAGVLPRNRGAGAVASVLAGVILMGWIAGEALMLRQPSWVEAFYFAIGLTVAGLGVLTRRNLRRAVHKGGK
jgi:hypothetical protein